MGRLHLFAALSHDVISSDSLGGTGALVSSPVPEFDLGVEHTHASRILCRALEARARVYPDATPIVHMEAILSHVWDELHRNLRLTTLMTRASIRPFGVDWARSLDLLAMPGPCIAASSDATPAIISQSVHLATLLRPWAPSGA